MILHPVQVDPSTLAPIIFGLLTIFGRGKKKDEKEENESTGQPSTIPKITQPTKGPTVPSQPQPEAYSSEDNNSMSGASPEESSLNKLLQSLLQDIPFTPPSESESNPAPTSTPDWVPPRATPPSRPMVIPPGGKALTPVEPEQAAPPVKTTKPPEAEQKPTPQLSKPVPQIAKPAPPVIQKPEQTDQEVKKPFKPEKPERQEAKPEGPRARATERQSFDHIFDLTQGSLKAPGLVIINGSTGSGKTSLSTNLAGSFLKSGSPCLLVTYDQSPASLRDKIKQAGWDSGMYESQFRLLLVDGFSSQSDSLSFEPYSVDKPFEMESVADSVLRNSQMFMGDKVSIIFDSLTELASRTPPKEFLTKFHDMSDKLKEAGATLIVTIDLGKLSKDIAGQLEDMAACVIDLQKDGQDGGRLNVRKLNGAVSKSEPENFELQAGKGILFV